MIASSTRSQVMGKAQWHAYLPDPARADGYDALYAEYRLLHDTFGGEGMLHRLRRIRNAARADAPSVAIPAQADLAEAEVAA